MLRTQLLLETWQYDALRLRAERRSISMSEIVGDYLKRSEQTNGVHRLDALGTDTTSRARDHDEFLYDKKRRR